MNSPAVVEKLVNENFHLAIKIARKFQDPDYDASLSAGMAGLLRAAELYNRNSNAQFQTFAWIKIEGKIKDLYTFNNAKKRGGGKVLYLRLDDPVERRNTQSSNNTARKLSEIIPDAIGLDPAESMSDDEQRLLIGKLLATLEKRDRRILELRFGFTCNPRKSLKEVGDILGLSDCRICILERNALLRLQDRIAENSSFAEIRC